MSERHMPKIFLSHRGQDAVLATEFALRLKEALTEYGRRTEVFNTSEPEYRFREGADREDLLTYLRQNLEDCIAYILLITDTLLSSDMTWVYWEIQEARERDSHFPYGRTFFFPCVLSVSRPHAAHDWLSTISDYAYIDLSSEKGFDRLVRELSRVIRRTEEGSKQ
jgi:hypothetical protein